MKAAILACLEESEFSLHSPQKKGQASMKETFIDGTEALEALLTCLSEHDLAALRRRKEAFIDGTDALEALLACLSEHDLAALQAMYASQLASAKREMEHARLSGKHAQLVQDWDAIYHALVNAQARRHLDTGSYEW